MTSAFEFMEKPYDRITSFLESGELPETCCQSLGIDWKGGKYTTNAPKVSQSQIACKQAKILLNLVVTSAMAADFTSTAGLLYALAPV